MRRSDGSKALFMGFWEVRHMTQKNVRIRYNVRNFLSLSRTNPAPIALQPITRKPDDRAAPAFGK